MSSIGTLFRVVSSRQFLLPFLGGASGLAYGRMVDREDRQIYMNTPDDGVSTMHQQGTTKARSISYTLFGGALGVVLSLF